MHDHIRDAVDDALADGALAFVPPAEFDRARRLNAPAPARAALFATLARLNTLYMIARAGSGHIGSSFSSLDIVSWLHLEVLHDGEDLYFSSKGHDVPGLYSVLIGLDRLPFEDLHRLRRLGGLPGHPDVATPGIAANTGSLGMGIAKAKGFVRAARLAGRPRRVFVLLGDGELQEGQIWESLIGAVNGRMHEITLIVDHNKLQSDTFVAAVNDLGDLAAVFATFGCAVERCDGHDLGAVDAGLTALGAITDRPKVLIADTIKGRGVSFMEHLAMAPGQPWYRFHSGAPSPGDYRRAVQELARRANAQLGQLAAEPLALGRVGRAAAVAAVPPPTGRMLPAYSDALLAVAERRPDLVVLDADLILDTGLIPFRERFPDRFVECGIAEQDMVSQASAMALAGLLPVVHSFACFLTARANEQIYNAASESTRIVYVGSLAGLVPAGPGHSHQGVRDLSAIGAIPGLVAVEPGHQGAVAPLLQWCVDEAPRSSYLRLCSVPYTAAFDVPLEDRPKLGRGRALTSGRDAVVFAYGPILLAEALSAAGTLSERGIGVSVVDLPWLNRIDRDWLIETVRGIPVVVSIDNHYRMHGQGALIAATIAEAGQAKRLLRLAVDTLPMCGQTPEVLRHHRLDADAIVATVAEAVRGSA